MEVMERLQFFFSDKHAFTEMVTHFRFNSHFGKRNVFPVLPSIEAVGTLAAGPPHYNRIDSGGATRKDAHLPLMCAVICGSTTSPKC